MLVLVRRERALVDALVHIRTQERDRGQLLERRVLHCRDEIDGRPQLLVVNE
jgi:hypothetical protein